METGSPTKDKVRAARRNSSLIQSASKLTDAEDALGVVDKELDVDFNQVSKWLSHSVEEQARKDETLRFEEDGNKSLLREVLDISETLEDGIGAIVDDSFTKCFNKEELVPWNFNIYLLPLWLIGVIVRYCVLFPIRLVFLVVYFLLFLVMYGCSRTLLPSSAFKFKFERRLLQTMCFVWVASWTGVIRCHGPKPTACKGRVWVCNHTSMVDFLVISQVTPFATVMQKHPGWLGLIQTYIMDSFGCVYFNRKEAQDRVKVAERIKDYVHNNAKLPLLIFPEGTCVNNRYCTMFKKGAFELDATVCPIALKYNRIFVNAFWSSRQQTFAMHLVELMTSWAVVADMYFLEPQYKREGESSIAFASRVQNLIAKKAKLKIVPWDGMLKYYSPSPKMCEQKRQQFASQIKKLQ